MKRQALIASAVSAVLASVYGCAPNPRPFVPSDAQRSTRAAAEELQARTLAPLPTTLDTTYAPRGRDRGTDTGPATQPTTGPALSEDPIVRLSLRQIIHRVVNNNLDIRVAGYEPAVNSNRVIEAEARFDPTFFFNPFYQWREAAADTTTLSSSVSDAELWGVATGIRQELETGATAELRYESNSVYQASSGLFGGETSFFLNQIVAELRQPLLRNFGTEVNRARIVVARNDQRISLLEFRRRLEEVLFSTEQTYWQLLQAQREVEILERLVEATIETAELLAKRGAQDVTRVETSQANSALQSRRAALIRAKSRVRDLSDQLKRLMTDPEYPVSGNLLILPATEPINQAIVFDPQDQINQSLEHRLELAQQLLRIDSASLVTRVAKNNLLPQLSMVSTYTLSGAANDWDGANYEMLDVRYNGWRLGVEFSIPIGNRQAEAIYQRTLLQRQQTIDEYRNIVEQVALEVRTALRNVETTWEERAAQRQAVLATTDTLDAIILRERGDEPLTPTFVQLKLDTQARLAEAMRAEAEAIANYSVAVAALERAKGTLLRYDNVLMAEDQLSVLARADVRAHETSSLVPPRTTRSAETNVAPVGTPVVIPGQ